ncbi:hypothetical protein L3X38_040924 [Prunus dulcis]|uniref:Uncharacterized protein n=2 Tax=Prunus dulcis TaxID=3755 RepID=A0AAD4YJT0_PRUDU|nr:hypothetical protein L3X38_040924 [Prunus dulcis]
METVKKFLEKEGEMAMTMDGLPDKFFESFIMEGIKVDLLEPGRIICFFKVPTTPTPPPHPPTPHPLLLLLSLLKGGNFMHGGAYAYPGEEVEIEAKALRV